ncbi:MAG: hypothetical protein P0S96_08430 [Simkaniaceae bacterium]|nr:hypothetical protein [Candidatus Sacchlamyda saccharinae]
MSGIKVRPSHRPHPGMKPPSEPPKFQFDYRSTLISMKVTGTQYGFRAFQFLSNFFSALKTAFKTEKKDPVSAGKEEVKTPTRSSKKVHLKRPEDFLKAFSKDPAKVIGRLLDLLQSKPETAKEILVNLARHWKEHPEVFFQYGKVDARRTAMRAALNDLFKEFVFSDTQKALQKKILDGDITSEEVQIMSGESVEKMTPALERFKQDFLAIKNPENLGRLLWDSILAFLEGRNALEDLEFLDGEERSFDRVVEEMLFHRSFASLHSDRSYRSNHDTLLALLDHLHRGDVLERYPAVESLVQKAHALLSDEEGTRRLKGLVRELLAIADPIAKSPPRKT